MITTLEMRSALRRLQLAHNKRSGSTEEMDELVGLWRYVFEGVSATELNAAVGEYLRSSSSRYFPKPSEILGLVEGRRPRTFAEPTGPGLGDSPCPVCGAVIQSLSGRQQDPEKLYPGSEDWPRRYGICHDLGRHRAAGVPVIGGSYHLTRGGRT